MSAILGITDLLSRTSLDAEMHCSRKSTTFSICPVLRPINTLSKHSTSPCDAPPRCRQTQRLAFLLGAVLAVEHGAAVGALPANRAAPKEKRPHEGHCCTPSLVGSSCLKIPSSSTPPSKVISGPVLVYSDTHAIRTAPLSADKSARPSPYRSGAAG